MSQLVLPDFEPAFSPAFLVEPVANASLIEREMRSILAMTPAQIAESVSRAVDPLAVNAVATANRLMSLRDHSQAVAQMADVALSRFGLVVAAVYKSEA